MKKTLVVLATFALIAAACNKNQTASNNASTQGQTQSQANSQSSHPQSLLALLSQGTQSCTFSDDKGTGSMYVQDGKARVDLIAMVNGVPQNVHSIIDSTTTYTWIDGQSTGFKSSTNASASTTGATHGQVDPNKQQDYKCSTWLGDSSKFTLPAGIKFTDLNSVNVKPTVPSVKGSTTPSTNMPTTNYPTNYPTGYPTGY